MRILFLVLVLANLGLAAWYFWFNEPEYPTRPVQSIAPSIELYADGSAQDRNEPAPSETSAPAISDTGQARRTCISVGPFPNRIDVEDARSALAASGFLTTQRSAQGDVWLGYWVYVDAIATQAEAANVVDSLAQEGISEAYVIADGNNGSIVSLGVFSEQARAQQRFSEAEALGLAPLIADRSQPGEVFWLDVTAPGGRGFAESELPAVAVNPRPQFVDCAAGERE